VLLLVLLSVRFNLSCSNAQALESGIDIVYFEVPLELRVHGTAIFSAGVKNNGPDTVHDLQFRFMDGDSIFNLSPIFDLPTGDSYNWSGHGLINGDAGAVHTYSIRISDKYLAVNRTLLPISRAYIEIQSFNMTPRGVKTPPEGGIGHFVINFTLVNSGNSTGSVNLSIKRSPWFFVLNDTIVMGPGSVYNGTMNYEDECRNIHLGEERRLWLEITGESTGPKNQTTVSYHFSCNSRSQEGELAMPMIVIGMFVVVNCILVLLFQRYKKSK